MKRSPNSAVCPESIHVDKTAPMPSTRTDLPTPTRLSAATTVVGVIGDPVAHSLSPLLHNTAFAQLGLDWVSVGFRVVAGSAGDALIGARALGVRGLSVTMPHKDAVADLVDRRSPLADRLGAVNCVVNGEQGSFGDNTDGPGLVAALRRGDRFDPAGRSCLVIGGGGAARAVVAALADAGATEVVVVNRSPARASSAAALAGPVGRVGVPADAVHCQLVVNATPVGMAGSDGGGATSWPLDPALVAKGQTVVDLVYHPLVTPWLKAARARGAAVSNGLGMLVHQAALQVGAWTGLEPPVDAMWRAVSGAQGQE
jgi:shikimate dehydrogenase